MKKLLILLLLFLGGLYFIVENKNLFINYYFNQAPKNLNLPLPKKEESKNLLTQADKADNSYTLILVGDSMFEYLGPNVTELRDYLKKNFPDKTFGIENYGFGATNILSVPDRLEKDTAHLGKVYPPILSKKFELILIESFGHNPLSEYPLQEGLKKQEVVLDKIVQTIKNKNPDAKIVFVATIAPNKKRYGEGAVVLMPEKRLEWATERIAYIENHIKYAKEHNIPLINIYEKSIDPETSDANIDFISGNDFIHPSPSGIHLISKTIADEISNQKLLD